MIVTHDIFLKAAVEYCERNKIDPKEITGWRTKSHDIREEFADLHERILILKHLGAL